MQKQTSLTHFVRFLLLFIAEGVAAFIWFISIPSEKGSGAIFGLSKSRWALAALIVLLIGCAVYALVRALHAGLETRLHSSLDRLLIAPAKRLFAVQTGMVLALIFLIELFFLTFILFPPFTRPLFLWAALFCLQSWLFLRLRYRNEYRRRPSLGKSIQLKWRAFSPVQRSVFLVLSLIGLVYFCIFIPLNSLGWNGPADAFYSGVDEHIQYPIAVYTLTPGETFSSTVYHLTANEDDVYGHPYVALEALILLPSRLIYGVNFGEKVQLNLMLLRQFINVLPLALAMFLLVYLITRFRSLWTSTALYLFLLTIPGTVKFGIRFLHPDALILLLIVLTIFFLQRDRYRFGKNFYLAAAACSLAAVIKLWGFFFFLPVAVYLLSGLFRKDLGLARMLRVGLAFILIMFVTALLSDPGLLIPSVLKELIAGVRGQIANRSVGYSEPGLSDVYRKDFPTWMKYFEIYYIQEYYFFFCFACLALAAFFSDRKLTALILLCWCFTLTVFFSNFLAAKSYWYLMELLVPLYGAPLLLPSLSASEPLLHRLKFLARPGVNRLLWGIVALFCTSQFVFNVIKIVTSPYILGYAKL